MKILFQCIKNYKPFFQILFLLFITISTTALKAQPKTDSITESAIANPKLITIFSGRKTASKIIAADFKKLVKADPVLIVKDEKGVAYTIVSFEFNWKQKSIADDVQTGKPTVNYISVGQKFRGNKLDADWIEEINETLNAGDELNFNTIIYFDPKKNKTFLAPELKIFIN